MTRYITIAQNITKKEIESFRKCEGGKIEDYMFGRLYHFPKNYVTLKTYQTETNGFQIRLDWSDGPDDYTHTSILSEGQNENEAWKDFDNGGGLVFHYRPSTKEGLYNIKLEFNEKDD